LNYSFLKDIVIGVSALVGMVLGLYNLIRSIKKEKVKLTIIPKAIMEERINTENGKPIFMTADNDFSNYHSLFGFEIINKSNFTVVVDEIGLIKKGKESRIVFPIPILGDKGNWPRELNPRNSFTVYCKLDNIIKAAQKHKIKYAYAKTSCEEICYGNSKAFELLKKFANKNV